MTEKKTSNNVAVTNSKSADIDETKTVKSRSEKAPEKNHAAANTVQGSGKGLAVLAILMSLVALGAVGYTWYQNQVKRVAEDSALAIGVTEIGGQVSRLGDTINALRKQQDEAVNQAQLSTRIMESNAMVEAQLQSIRDEQRNLSDAIQKINDGIQKGVSDFVLDEVSQLLRLANNSAVFSSDTRAAINALSLADIQLKELAEPRFSEVRRTINEEIAQLENVKTVDVEKVSAQLTALFATVPSLPLANEPPARSTVAITNAEAVEENLSWRTELRKIWQDMISAISIQRVDQPPKPLLAPDQRYFLNQNLQLNLNKAEIALLQRQPVIYIQSLESAIVWLEDYFDTSDKRVESAVRQLNELKAQNIVVELPVISGSYDALQSIKGGQ